MSLISNSSLSIGNLSSAGIGIPSAEVLLLKVTRYAERLIFAGPVGPVGPVSPVGPAGPWIFPTLVQSFYVSDQIYK